LAAETQNVEEVPKRLSITLVLGLRYVLVISDRNYVALRTTDTDMYQQLQSHRIGNYPDPSLARNVYLGLPRR
jgi:hypothetical protein